MMEINLDNVLVLAIEINWLFPTTTVTRSPWWSLPSMQLITWTMQRIVRPQMEILFPLLTTVCRMIYLVSELIFVS